MHGVCLIGCGRIARVHAHHLEGRAELFCHSRSLRSAQKLAAEHGARAVETWDEVLRRDEVEALVICSPPEHHCEQVVAGLQAGKAVLVEKPMCIGPQEVERIAAAAAECPPGRLMVAENYYYKPSLHLLQWFLRHGFAGEVRDIYVRKVFQQPAAGWKQAHGALLEGGIHFVALISALAESCGCEKPVRVRGAFPGRSAATPERRSRTQVEYEGGLTAVLDYAWNQRALLKGLLQHSRVRGSRGRIVFESNGLYVLALCRGRHRLYLPGVRDLMGYRAMTRDFLSCLERGDHVPRSSFQRARRDLDIVFQAYGGDQVPPASSAGMEREAGSSGPPAGTGHQRGAGGASGESA